MDAFLSALKWLDSAPGGILKIGIQIVQHTSIELLGIVWIWILYAFTCIHKHSLTTFAWFMLMNLCNWVHSKWIRLRLRVRVLQCRRFGISKVQAARGALVVFNLIKVLRGLLYFLDMQGFKCLQFH